MLSPSCMSSQEELYCSLVGNSPGLTPAAAVPAPPSSPAVTCISRPRRNAMVKTHRLLPLHSACRSSSFVSQSSTSPSVVSLWIIEKEPGRFHSQYKSITCLLQASGSRPHLKRVKALVDCRAVSSEQLAFFKDEIIVVTTTTDAFWWVSTMTTV